MVGGQKPCRRGPRTEVEYCLAPRCRSIAREPAALLLAEVVLNRWICVTVAGPLTRNRQRIY
jgi:hypothetical protein